MTRAESARLEATLRARGEEYLGYLKDLVAIDTQVIGHGIAGGRERKGQEYLRGLLEPLGAEIAEEPLDEAIIQRGIAEYGEGNPGHEYGDGDRYDLVARFAGARGGRSLLFDGHVDTMPPGDLSLWRSDPHAPTVEGGMLRGLGACDMKAGLMASAMARKLVKDEGLGLPGDVTLLSVVDEEGGGNGTLAAMLRGHRADAAVVCEPTDRTLIAAHMGFVFFEVRTSGKALHSGKKWEGVSAIEKAILLIDALGELERRWLASHKHALLPAPSLNVGVIEGGSAGSTVSGSCVFKICVHYLPGAMDRASVERDVLGAIETRSAGDAWLREHPPVVGVYQAGGAFEQDASAEFPRIAARCMEGALGSARFAGSPAGNDARLLRRIGGMPTLVAGPGALDQCHSVNESVPVEEYYEFILFYARLIMSWCGGPDHEEGNGTV